MAIDSKSLEERLLDFGKSLASPPSSSDQLYSLLEKIDTLLSNVEQSPSESTLTALQTLMKELVVKELLRHPDMDVKAAVASCLSEITRITAPEAPFDDDIMKEISQMIVGAFGMLGDMSSRAFDKRVSVLETVSKVRFCVLMLDLECDALILEMFHHFVKVIRPDHAENVFTAMLTIMTLVIEESEDISSEITSCLLNTVKEDNKDVLPIARDLVEKVMDKCADKLKPCLLEFFKSTGASLGEYGKAVASICQEISNSVGHNESNKPHGSGEVLADDRKLSERTLSETVVPQVSEKQEQGGVSPAKVDSAADTSPAASTSHFTSQMGNGDSMEQPSSPKQKADVSCRIDQLNVAEQVVEHNLESISVKPDDTSEIKRASSPVHLTDKPDDFRIDGDKDAPGCSTEANSLLLDASAKEVEPAVSLEPKEKNEVQHISESDNPSGATPIFTESPMNYVRTKRGRPSGSKEAAKQSDGEAAADKPASASGEKDTLPSSETVITKSHDAKNEPEIVDDDVAPTTVTSDSEVKLKGNSVKNVGLKRKSVEEDSSGRTKKSRSKQQKKDNSLGKDAPIESSLKKSEVSDHKKDQGENLVGSMIKVWWPDDEEFYYGVVDSFNPKDKKHKIVYSDGDVEKLVLKDERWEFTESGTTQEGGKQKDLGNASQKSRIKREKSSSNALSKQAKSPTPSRSGTEPSSKNAAKRKGKPRSGASAGGKLSYDDSSPGTSRNTRRKTGTDVKVKTPKSRVKNDGPESGPEDETPEPTQSKQEEEPGSKSKDETIKLRGKAKDETPKTSGKSRRGRKSNKKGNQNLSSMEDDTPLKGIITRKPKEATPKTASRVEDNLIDKNHNTKASGGSSAKGTSSKKGKAKVKAGESASTAGLDGSEVKTGGTGGRKRKRKGSRK